MEKNYGFKVGDKVKIRKDSEYYGECVISNPAERVGYIERMDSKQDSSHHFIKVSWGDSYNAYRADDLELVKEESLNENFKRDVLSIRDRIYQIREDILSLEAEQKNLIEILGKEGFILKECTMESPIPEGVDVNDWRTWKVGDMVEMVVGHDELQQGKLYPILEIEPTWYLGEMPVMVGGSHKTVAWPELERLHWHSRPTD